MFLPIAAVSVAAVDPAAIHIVMLPLADRTTIVIELPEPPAKVEEIPTEGSSVAIEAGPISASVLPQTLAPAAASSPIASVAASAITHPDGALYLRIQITTRQTMSHRLRPSGARVYVDFLPPTPTPAASPSPPPARPSAPLPKATGPRASEPSVRSNPSREKDRATDPALSYAALESRTLSRARELAAQPDVKGLLRLREEVERRDKELGVGQPDLMNRLTGELQRYLEQARALQLERDRAALLKQKANP